MAAKYIKAFDHKEKLWTVSRQDEKGKITTLKKSKTDKEIKNFLNKKPNIKATVKKYKKASHYNDGIILESKQQKFIDKVIYSEAPKYDDLIQAEKLSKGLKYREKDFEKRKSIFDVPQHETKAMSFKSEFFYSSGSDGIFVIRNTKHELLNTILKKKKSYQRFEMKIVTDDDEEMKIIFSRDEIYSNQDITKKAIGSLLKSQMSEDKKTGDCKITIKGLI